MIPPTTAARKTTSRLSKSFVRKRSGAGIKAPLSASTAQVLSHVEVVKNSSGWKAVLVRAKALKVRMTPVYRYNK
jgi:hypothetical protein